jgi:hypothetical protein
MISLGQYTLRIVHFLHPLSSNKIINTRYPPLRLLKWRTCSFQSFWTTYSAPTSAASTFSLVSHSFALAITLISPGILELLTTTIARP